MGAVDPLQLRAALAHQEKWGGKLGKALVDLRFCAPADVANALALQTGLTLIDLDAEQLEPRLAYLIPVKTAERLGVVPLRLEGKRQEALVFAAVAPAGLATLDAVRSVSGKSRVVPQLASDGGVERAIGFLYYGKPREAAPPTAVPLRELRIETESSFEPEAETQSPEEVPLEATTLAEATFARAAPSAPRAAQRQTGQVWLFGWDEARGKALTTMLKMGGVEARLIEDEALLGVAAEDVIVASTLALHAVLPAGQKLESGKLIICGLAHDADMKDAHDLGARLYLRPPFSPEQLAKSIARVQR